MLGYRCWSADLKEGLDLPHLFRAPTHPLEIFVGQHPPQGMLFPMANRPTLSLCFDQRILPSGQNPAIFDPVRLFC